MGKIKDLINRNRNKIKKMTFSDKEILGKVKKSVKIIYGSGKKAQYLVEKVYSEQKEDITEEYYKKLYKNKHYKNIIERFFSEEEVTKNNSNNNYLGHIRIYEEESYRFINIKTEKWKDPIFSKDKKNRNNLREIYVSKNSGNDNSSKENNQDVKKNNITIIFNHKEI